MAKVIVKCPNPDCPGAFRVDESNIGKSARCKKCGTRFVIGPVQRGVAVSEGVDSSRAVSIAGVPPAPAAARARPAAAGGKPATAPAAWKAGDVIAGLYEVRGTLGEGGMGVVYRVYKRDWHRELAVKCPRPQIFIRESGKRDFVREAETWTDLGMYPHIVNCHYVEEIAGVPSVFVELVAGRSLAAWVRDGRLYQGAPPDVLRRILDIAIQFAWGLHYAHEQGFVHQDVKPANVMMTPDGVAKVTDFGLARARAAAGERASAPASAAGLQDDILVSRGGMTPAYCSPEQAGGEKLTRATDVWSWGVSVLEMFNGGLTWRSGVGARQALENYAKLGPKEASIPTMPGAVADLLRRCFQRDPAGRPGHMQQIADELRAVYQLSLNQAYPRSQPRAAELLGGQLSVANLNNRAVSKIAMGKPEEADALLQQAGRGVVSQEVAYNWCLLQLRTDGQLDLSNAETLISQQPDPHKHAYLVGMLLLEGGEIKRAINVLTPAVKAEGEHRIDALNARGIGLLLSGETRPAALSFREALKAEPQRLDILRNLALAHYYDGRPAKALRIFEQLSERTVMDAEDTIRHATVLSAAGLKAASLETLREALGRPDRNTVVELTAAELLDGSCTFLPGATPVGTDESAGRKLAEQAAAAEPWNLRAQVDRQTLPARYGLRGRSVVKDMQRVCPPADSPAEVAGCMLFSHRSMTKSSRWGDVPNWLHRIGLLILGAVPIILVLELCILLPALLREGDAALSLALIPSGIVAWAALLRARPGRSALGEMLRLFIPFVVLWMMIAPVRLWELALWQTAMLAAAFIVGEFVHQRLLARLRAGVRLLPIHRSASVRALASAPGPQNAGKGRPSSRPAGGVVSPKRIPAPGALESLLRTLPDTAGPRLRRFAHRVRWQYLGWIPYLLPEAGLGIVTAVLLPLGSFDPGAGAAVGVIAALFAVSLVTAAPTMPKWFLRANMAWSVLAGLMFPAAVAAFFLEEPKGGEGTGEIFAKGGLACVSLVGMIAMPVVFFLLNRMAIRRCPAYARECERCTAGNWDVRQVVDPLNIRRYAAPWQLIQLTEAAATGGAVGPPVLREAGAGP